MDVGKQRKPLTEMEIELAQVKRELAEVKMEHDCSQYIIDEIISDHD